MVNILVPVDFSKTSVNALYYAIDLFGGEAIEITILHIYGVEATALTMKSFDDILVETADKQMNELIDEINIKYPEVKLKPRLSKNYAVDTISKMGDSGNYDLIVMGTKGVSGIKEVFMGSIAGGVVSKTMAPVIVVPLDYEFKVLDYLVLAIGDQPLSDNVNLNLLTSLQQQHKSSLEVLHISDNNGAQKEIVKDTLKELKPSYTIKSASGDLNQQLNVHIQNNDTDLLCLLKTKKDFLHRLFSNSVTLKQTFNSPIPLLIIQS
ncbi:universal stress protein [Winogradskyella aurantiaca]|uniref:universal stress protein n=1 Tax=Winogradskyella aurantiaca TaxID=2219558 RepID=UPI000E1D531A|nr:universal stress protein [Winogradskyella aurantiaca]